MLKDILLDSGHNQIRMAILEDGVPVEIHIEKRENKSLVGNIYRGKVVRVLKGMQSAFVDIGLDKNAFLYVKDIAPIKYDDNGEITLISNQDISRLLTQGQEISVQVIKDALGEKGPRVTTRLSLPGRYSVLMPRSNVLGVSKKIKDQEERKRLRQIAQASMPPYAGIIVRTAAEGVPDEVISEDIENLKILHESILNKERKGKVPRLLYGEPGIIAQTVREYLKPDINRFIVNDLKEYEKIISILEDTSPELKPKVQYFTRDYDMFSYYNVESALLEALSRKVWLKSGAYLIFDYTEALTVIDVNSGKFVGKLDLEDTALKINLEAAKSIAHQIRLRNLSGIIIVDFIDMHKKEHREQVVQTLRDLVKEDKTHTVVMGMTELGLVEITRKKIRQPLYKSFTEVCSACDGTGFRPIKAHR
ncbi:MAG: Rne/Rng family ribonuclease [Clostridiaceae bacterium]|nr:Rne/Rng family ribonuclease [Clostridiaceae bacterium]